jgi:hypothetical protein
MSFDLNRNTNGAAFDAYDAFRTEVEKAGGEFPFPVTTHYSAWTMVADVAGPRGLDPRRLVQAQFAALNPKKRAGLTPDTLKRRGTDVLLRNYFAMQPEQGVVRTDWEKVHRSQVDRLRGQCTRMIPLWYRTPAELLADPHQPFESWFRVGVLPSYDEAVVSRYRALALAEIADDPTLATYVEHHHDQLPGLTHIIDSRIQ